MIISVFDDCGILLQYAYGLPYVLATYTGGYKGPNLCLIENAVDGHSKNVSDLATWEVGQILGGN